MNKKESQNSKDMSKKSDEDSKITKEAVEFYKMLKTMMKH